MANHAKRGKQSNRNIDRRRLRRILNKTIGAITYCSRKLMKVRYGDGINQRSFGKEEE